MANHPFCQQESLLASNAPLLPKMPRSDTLSSLLSHPETRTASTSLLLIGVLVGGSATAAGLWLISRHAFAWRRRTADGPQRLSCTGRAQVLEFICVLDGLSKICERDAIEVASCYGVRDVWVRWLQRCILHVKV